MGEISTEKPEAGARRFTDTETVMESVPTIHDSSTTP